jgi:hypothetical protein
MQRLSLVEVSASARSSRRSSTSPATRSMARRAFERRSSAQSRRAAFAEAIARCASSRVPLGTVPSTSPVAGLVASTRSPDSESTHAPPTNIE